MGCTTPWWRKSNDVATHRAESDNAGGKLMTLREAIIAVLTDAREPMHYKDIWKEIKRRRLYQSEAEHPEQSVGSLLYTDETFRQVSPACFVLARGRSQRRQGTLRDAIVQVLTNASEPMHYKEIWEEIERLDLYRSTAENPEQSVGSWLYTDAAFRQTAPAEFELASKRRAEKPAKREEPDRLRFDESVVAEAEEMATHYRLFYCLERTIRAIICRTMEEVHGKDWWAHVPPAVREEAEKNREQEEASPGGPRSEQSIDFVTFGQLTTLVENNWRVFENTFRNAKAFKGVMSGLNRLRNPIAHCCPLTGDEPKRFEIAVNDWFKLLSLRNKN